nr:amidohydrolase family protein [Burkholderia multivorans]
MASGHSRFRAGHRRIFAVHPFARHAGRHRSHGARRYRRRADSPSVRALCALLDTGNVWVKLSGADRMSKAGAPFEDTLPVARRLAEHAPERVLWGSDWPHVNLSHPMPDDGDLVDLIARIVPDERRRIQMLVDNPARFFGFR